MFSAASTSLMLDVLDQVPGVITEDMNNLLSAEFLVCEVVSTLKQMAPLKALGLNGLPPLLEYG